MLFALFSEKQEVPDHTTEINRLLISLSDDWQSAQSGDTLRKSEQSFDYCVLDKNGDMLFTTRQDMSQSVSSAVSHYDIIRDIERGGEKLGTLIVHDPLLERQQKKMHRLAISCAVMMALMLALSVAFFMVLKKRVVEPFKNMKGFAERIAAGELDTPLEMDKDNIFGAFSESFDIMREELKAARGRVGSPLDIANMVLYLCSDKAGFITGENICIDGGMTRQMIYHGDNGWTLDI